MPKLNGQEVHILRDLEKNDKEFGNSFKEDTEQVVIRGVDGKPRVVNKDQIKD